MGGDDLQVSQLVSGHNDAGEPACILHYGNTVHLHNNSALLKQKICYYKDCLKNHFNLSQLYFLNCFKLLSKFVNNMSFLTNIFDSAYLF
jgi:hypothetical protein